VTCEGFVDCHRCDRCLACDPHEHWDEYGVLIDEERVLPSHTRERAEASVAAHGGTLVHRVVTASPWQPATVQPKGATA
jgi:hypothetical protein